MTADADIDAEMQTMEQEVRQAEREIVRTLYRYHSCRLVCAGAGEAVWEDYKAALAARERLGHRMMLRCGKLIRERIRRPGRRSGRFKARVEHDISTGG